MTFSFRRKSNLTRDGHSVTWPIVENGQLTGCIFSKSEEELPEMTEEEFQKLMGEAPTTGGS